METSEGMEKVLLQEAEAGIRKLLQSLQTLKEGDLKGLEQQIMASVFSMGRKWMEQVLSAPAAEVKEPAERTGECGHVQQLVGYRPRQVLTLLGKITFKRAYYQCCVPAEEPADEQKAEAQSQQLCTHGEAPADARWGLQGQRTTAGVQQTVSYLCATSTLEEAAKNFSRLLPLQMSARQVVNALKCGSSTLLVKPGCSQASWEPPSR